MRTCSQCQAGNERTSFSILASSRPIHFCKTESTLWTKMGQARRPEAQKEMENSRPGCMVDWANNTAAQTDSPRKRPSIRPQHIHLCQRQKKEKRGNCRVFGCSGRNFICTAFLRLQLCWLAISSAACFIVPSSDLFIRLQLSKCMLKDKIEFICVWEMFALCSKVCMCVFRLFSIQIEDHFFHSWFFTCKVRTV